MSSSPAVSSQPLSPTFGRKSISAHPRPMQNLPPVFSPDNSPPMSAMTSRKHYLPLVSPVQIDDDRPFDFSRRRGSTPSLQKSSASQYFEDLRKRRRTSETAHTDAAEANAAPVYVQQQDDKSITPRFAELPSGLAQTIVRALEEQAKSISLKKRTMSLPSSQSNYKLQASPDSLEGIHERRASMRSRQLALLASQARLARTGSTSVQTAMVAERAVKGAVQKVVEEVQAGKSNMTKDTDSKKELKDPESSDDAQEGDRKVKADANVNGVANQLVVDLQTPNTMWSQALSSPQAATAFLDSASEVAHDWANGFYKFEEEWAGDALRKEKQKLDENHAALKRSREDDEGESSADPKKSASPPRGDADQLISPTSKSAKLSGDDSPAPSVASPSLSNKLMVSVPPSLPTSSARSSLMAAHKRLSMSLPVMPTVSKTTASENGGQLVDVLSDFVELIGQRKEVCHGLEKLAQDARRLSTVQLPTFSAALASRQKAEQDEEMAAGKEEAEDDLTGH